VAREVLRLGSAGQHDAVLRVLGDNVDQGAGGHATARKAFLRISMLIHPDKLPGFADATKAFQVLVSAFDRTTQASAAAAVRSKGPGVATLARSNEGCYRTEVMCPRCHVPWGQKCEGNPDYFYNFMMEGLRCFNCATCLLSFGCLTAVHRCPFCHDVFEYGPDVYHRKVKCGSAKCSKSFGFMLFHASEQALKTAREQVRRDLERSMATDEAKTGRAARAARRAGQTDPNMDEVAFAMGLKDTCPRCGLALEDYEDGEQMRHLRSCTDASAHKAHKDRERQRAAAEAAASAKAKAQSSATSGAAWAFAGGGAERLWMLDAEQLRKRCKEAGLPTGGPAEALIARLVERYPDIGTQAVDLPSNLHALSDAKLAAVCAAHGLSGQSSREERLEALEELHEDTVAAAVEDRKGGAKKALAAGATGKAKAKAKPLALEDGPKPKAKTKAAVHKLRLFAKSKAATKAKAKAKGVASGKAGAKGKAKAKAASGKRPVGGGGPGAAGSGKRKRA